MNESIYLLSLGNFHLTAYGLCLTCGFVLAIALTVLLARKTLGIDNTLTLCTVVAPCALLGARILYILPMMSYLPDFGGASFAFKLWEGGYTLFGAVLGGMLGAWLFAKKKGSLLHTFDVMAPGAALAICVARAAEYFTTQGLGDYVEDEALWYFPLAVENYFEMWQIPVFFYEAIAALVICIVCLLVLKQGREGRTAEVFLTLLSLTQIILESLREDEFIRFGFVRFSMIMGAVTVAVVAFLSLRRCLKKTGWTRWQIARTVMFLVGVVVVILIEFALDKSTINNVLLYVIMAATLGVMGVATLREGVKG